ncbi:DUF4382 domain-containing protein [Sinomicrobium pectinilyticum]|uniref:DUF4382 domain-containing protein n=1 Tax=Sinomicrobium pectinilyticum TaxID=1084421 RepID=A0A3N0ELF6_SINP1|nr:DUF4382 domain-containing protein [Sinomicrobium pectinilyticum]RNL88718.1 DUF4382 domain-containing protein [Sinomicrobium pectinilyticum]
MKHLRFIIIVMFSGLLLATSCSDDDDDNKQTARVSVKLTDAPGDYEAVNIDVQDVQIKREDSDEEGNWESIGPVEAKVYNLLELTGGINALLAENDIPSGKLEQMRLVLGNENTIVIEGTEIPLTTPSAEQSGLKLNIHETLEAGFTYNFVLDFDVEQSIVNTGAADKFILKPVIRVSTEVSSGIITGTVSPADFQVLASVETSEGEIISAYTDADGSFSLYGVPEGTYTVTLLPDPESGIPEVSVENVTVTKGEISDIGTVDLNM